jgi:methionyl-tRNA synthetase
MGFSFSQNEIEAYIRDELFSNAANLADASVQNVINRCFDSRIEEHYPDLKEPFFDELNIIWKSVSSKYNIFKDSPQGKIRKRALEVIDQHNTWIRELDKRQIEITPKMENAFRSLMQIMAPLYSLVVLLNSDEEIKEPQLKKFINMLDVTKSVHKMRIQEIDDPLKR